MSINDDQLDWDQPLRDEIRTWLEENWDPDLQVKAWWTLVAKAGWCAPYFPMEQYGRGLPREAIVTIREEFTRYGALPPPGGLGVHLAAPTVLTHGTPEQIEEHVAPALAGARGWCQLFSEPGYGSDLAGITTRAVRDGDMWVINGQKVWSSNAVESNYGMLLARTNFDVEKHKGISWFAFDLEQAGVEIRPLRQMTGHSEFNEVFFDNALCPVRNLIGGEGYGWSVARTTLQFERVGMGPAGTYISYPHAGTKGDAMAQASAGLAARLPPGLLEYGPSSAGTVTVPELVQLAKEYGRSEDPVIRNRIAALSVYVSTGEWTSERAGETTDSAEGARLAPLGKIAQTRIFKMATEIALDIIGPDALLWPPEGPRGGQYPELFVQAASHSIGGGTIEIQKNIISEKVLGMPRESDPSRGTAYRDVLKWISDSQAGRNASQAPTA